MSEQRVRINTRAEHVFVLANIASQKAHQEGVSYNRGGSSPGFDFKALDLRLETMMNAMRAKGHDNLDKLGK